jgi:hypothetical protein
VFGYLLCRPPVARGLGVKRHARHICMKTSTLLLLATTISATACRPPRPAVKPVLKLRGGALVQWPALYKQDANDKASEELTPAGHATMGVIMLAGIFGLHAISFHDLILRLPVMGRFTFFILATFADDFWPKRTVGRLATHALLSATLMYAACGGGLNLSLGCLAIALTGAGIGEANRMAQRWIKANIRRPFNGLFHGSAFFFLVLPFVGISVIMACMYRIGMYRESAHPWGTDAALLILLGSIFYGFAKC